MAGQHVDIRLTADNGYQAERSYSIASPAGCGPHVELTVERISDGEVSPFLTDELRIGDAIELRGPIGGYFAWAPGTLSPLMLIAGGSGVVPLVWHLVVNLRVALDEEYRLRDGRSVTPTGSRAGSC